MKTSNEKLALVRRKVPYAPIEYRRMKVIAQGREQASALYRIKVCFRNVLRARSYFVSAIWKDKQRDYASISDVQIEQAANDYLNILRDMKDFAAAKHIALSNDAVLQNVFSLHR